MAGWGATGAALIALAGNRAVRAMLSEDARDVFGNAIAPPLVEEGAKGLALLAAVGPIRWAGRRFGLTIFEGVTSGMVYGAAVGLGFAFTEDVFYFVNEAQTQGLENGLDVFVHRRDFFGPAMLHHPLWTAAFGAGLGAAAWTPSRVRKVLYPLAGFSAAVLMHAINNGLVEAVLDPAATGWRRRPPGREARSSTRPMEDMASTLVTLTNLLDFYVLAMFIARRRPLAAVPAADHPAERARRTRSTPRHPPVGCARAPSGAASSSAGATSGGCDGELRPAGAPEVADAALRRRPGPDPAAAARDRDARDLRRRRRKSPGAGDARCSAASDELEAVQELFGRSDVRLRHAHRPGRHRQDAARDRGRADAFASASRAARTSSRLAPIRDRRSSRRRSRRFSASSSREGETAARAAEGLPPRQAAPARPRQPRAGRGRRAGDRRADRGRSPAPRARDEPRRARRSSRARVSGRVAARVERRRPLPRAGPGGGTGLQGHRGERADDPGDLPAARRTAARDRAHVRPDPAALASGDPRPPGGADRGVAAPGDDLVELRAARSRRAGAARATVGVRRRRDAPRRGVRLRRRRRGRRRPASGRSSRRAWSGEAGALPATRASRCSRRSGRSRATASRNRETRSGSSGASPSTASPSPSGRSRS